MNATYMTSLTGFPTVTIRTNARVAVNKTNIQYSHDRHLARISGNTVETVSANDREKPSMTVYEVEYMAKKAVTMNTGFIHGPMLLA